MKKDLIVSNKAKSDLKEIRQYIQQENAQEAKRFMADLTAKIEWIAKVDFTGSPRDYISTGLRALPYRKRCIYYYSHNESIKVVRVFHGAQDITQKEFNEK